MASDLVYLVTGGCGFMGEHIVNLLVKEEYVGEVRVFDKIIPEEVKAFWTDTSKVKVVQGDITDYDQILVAMKGVHAVIHSAAILDFLEVLPAEKMESVNVGGTKNVLKACYALNIQYLIYTSSITALGPNVKGEPLIRGTEESQYTGETAMLYGKTKAMAEKLVLTANGTQLPNGRHFYTCVIRPAGIYGEKHKELKDCYMGIKAKNGLMNHIAPLESEQVFTYVGNVAWMHVLALRNLQIKPEQLGGQFYFAYDDSPLKSIVMFRYELFSEIDPNIRLGKQIPYWQLWVMIFLHGIARSLLSPFWKLQPFLTFPLLQLMVTTFSYQTDKAFRHFGYQPLYSWEESKKNTIKWLQTTTSRAEFQ